MKTTLNNTLSALSCASASPRRAFVVALCTFASLCDAQTATFTEIELKIPPQAAIFQIRDIADNGTVLGVYQGGGPSEWGFLWTKDVGIEDVKPLSTGYQTFMGAISPSGHIMVGGYELHNGTIRAAYWLGNEGPFDAVNSTAGYSIGFAIGISADETYVVGQMRNGLKQLGDGFISPIGGKPNFVGGLPGGNGRSSLQGVSVGGTRALGDSFSPLGHEAARWTHKTGLQSIGDLPGGGVDAGIWTCSADGRVAVGFGNDGSRQLVRWTEYHGMTKLPNAAANQGAGRANGISGDGWRVVGVSRLLNLGGNRANIWDPVNGSRMLQDALEQEYNLDIGDWILVQASAISDNGRFIAGTMGTLKGEVAAYLVELPAFCYADCNADKNLDIMDYLCFIDEYDKESVYANCNNDGSMDILDYICFGDHFAQGCP